MQIYPESKVYFDGSHYIAIPPSIGYRGPRRKRNEEVIFVNDNGLVKNQPKPKEQVSDLIELIEANSISQETQIGEVGSKSISKNNGEIRQTTRKELFEEAYDESIDLSKSGQKDYILNQLAKYFKSIESLEAYVDRNIERKNHNYIARRNRILRKAYMANFNYFATFTYDSSLMEEETFQKRIMKTLYNFDTRKGWKFLGAFELSPEKKRLHLHILLYVPKGTMSGELIEVKDYDTRNHKMQITHENTFFKKKFGRNDFEELDGSRAATYSSLQYILKYIRKDKNKILMSRNLPMYAISDIFEEDVVCKCGRKDKKLLLFDDFTCMDEGEILGKVTEGYMAQLRTSAR